MRFTSSRFPAGEQPDAAAEVIELEKRIEQAVLRADVDFLDAVCADDFTYTHGDGWTTGEPVLSVDRKQEWLASLDGRYSLREVDFAAGRSPRRCRDHDGTGAGAQRRAGRRSAQLQLLVRPCVRLAGRCVAVPLPPHGAWSSVRRLIRTVP